MKHLGYERNRGCFIFFLQKKKMAYKIGGTNLKNEQVNKTKSNGRAYHAKHPVTKSKGRF